MKHALIPSLVLALMLSACGGGGGSGSASSKGNDKNIEKPKETEGEKPTKVEGEKPPKVEGEKPKETEGDKPLLSSEAQVIKYYGDSTIWGYASAPGVNKVANPAPEVFASQLPSSHRVLNKGKNGQTACDLLRGDGGEVLPWRDELKRTDEAAATVVILNHGINDAKATFSPAGYAECLEQIADIAREEKKTVIFETPNPVSNDNEAQLAQLVERMKAVAREKNLEIIDQYAYLSQASLTDGWPDTEHPSDIVYEMKGNYAAQRYLEMRKK